MRGRIVFVTGGGAGIGRALALLCAERGARVAIADRDATKAAEAAADALARGASAALGIACDVSAEADVAAAFARVEGEMGTPTAVFANAGVGRGGLLHELPFETWREVLATNLDGVYHTAKCAIAAMLREGTSGSIVCVSSPAASVAFADGGAAAYSASKGGVSALVRCLAVDYARHGIRVNAIVPGSTETAMMWAAADPANIPALRRQIASEIPLGRLARPEEPARAALWLFSSDASYVTGSHLVCDGGILAKASISF